MAKYKASLFYEVKFGDSSIKFDHVGEYETTDAKEIEALDALCPAYIQCVEKDKPKTEKKAEESAPKAPAKKASAK